MVAENSYFIARILLLNPVAQAIQDIRFNLITTETATTWNFSSLSWSLASIAICLTTFAIGICYFQKKSKYFAEEV